MRADTLTDIPLSFTASGDNTLITGVAGKVIEVYKVWMVFSADVTVTFKSGTENLSGAVPMKAGGAIVLDDTQSEPWFKTNAGESFIANLSGAQAVAGMAYYRLADG